MSARNDMRHFTPETSSAPMRGVLNAIVAPRPVAWISTVSAAGTPNVAPHSYTTVFSTEPPILGFVSSGRKDTLRNVEATGAFVYNVASERLLERMNLTAADFPPETSEFGWAGLTPTASDVVVAPRVGEAEVAIECRVVEVRQVPGADAWLVLGEAVAFHVAGAALTDGRIDPARVRPIARLSGNDYATFGEVVTLPRPTYRGLQEAGAEPLPPFEG
jgi:flavin reductase (DIM6/NTAB) family NADH-FMN oxidoreductase RutF